MRLWNPATGRRVGKPLHASAQYGGVHVVAFSPDGKLLAGAARRHRAAVEPGHRPPRRVPSRPAPALTACNGVAFSPDGKLLAAGCGDGTVRLWNPATGRPVAAPSTPPPTPCTALTRWRSAPTASCWPPANGDGTVRAWNPATGQPVGAPIQTGSGPAGAVFVVAFSPDGKLLAAAATTAPCGCGKYRYSRMPTRQLCADVGPPTPQEWNHYASGEPQPKVCG